MKRVLVMTATALVFASSTVLANAQTAPSNPGAEQGLGMMQHRHEMRRQGQDMGQSRGRMMMSPRPDDETTSRKGNCVSDDRQDGSETRSPGWRPHQHGADMRSGMTGSPMMDGGTMLPGMLRMMIILADTNGDGIISLEEFQAAHERIFRAMDGNHDGKLTLEEMQSFIRTMGMPAKQP